MPADIREYLLDRFTSDSTTLRHRAESLQAQSQTDVNKPSPGPNAALSSAMANACDNVVALAQQLPEHASVAVIVDALQVMVPKLTQLANSPEAASSPAVRSVYMGASTRVQELIAAESSATASESLESDDDDAFDEILDDDLVDDDVDDDDDDAVDNDDLHEDTTT
ncbi:MAG: hypothetical protein ABJB74_06795 [Gemmatimonas sp.]